MAILLYDLVGADAGRPFSPHCWKAKMALAHKGLEFDSVPTPFTSVPKVEGGASKIVPVIRDGDKVVADSFEIALYLEDAYPDRPTLFGGDGGKAMARFIERWSQLTLHSFKGAAAVLDIHQRLDAPDKAYFRQSRETRFGKSLEDVTAARDAGLAAYRASLEPLRSMLAWQPFIGGRVAAVRRLHRVRRLPVGAGDLDLSVPGRGRSGRRVVRALPRPAWRPRPQGAGRGIARTAVGRLARHQRRRAWRCVPQPWQWAGRSV